VSVANRERGEQALVVGDRTLIARVTTNACVELEDFAPGKNWDLVRVAASRGSRRDLRLFFWTIFRDHHPELCTDDVGCLKAIGELIDQAGGSDSKPLGKWIGQFAKLNEELAEGLQKKAKGGKPEPVDPPDAQAVAGMPSTEMPALSV
jgi:hypothetical protein